MAKSEGLNIPFTLGVEGDDGAVEQIKALPAAVKEKRFRLVIEEEENALNYVPVGVNGVVYQIMRGVEVEVPQSVLTVLEQAKASRVAQERLPDGTMRTYIKSFNRYPYRVLGDAV
jgi:hypothetical protein